MLYSYTTIFFSNCIMLYAVYRSTSSTLNEKTKEMKENVHINCESAVKGNKINRSSVSDLQPFKVVLLQKKIIPMCYIYEFVAAFVPSYSFFSSYLRVLMLLYVLVVFIHFYGSCLI